MRNIIEEDGQRKFEGNRIVKHLLSVAKSGNKADLNLIWEMYSDGLFTRNELKELYQLMGFPISGYLELFEEDDETVYVSSPDIQRPPR